MISTLTGLFENINLTRESCTLICEQMFLYLLEVLENVSEEYFSYTASPSQTNEMLLLNHNILRVFLSVCQEFGQELKSHNCDFIRLTNLLKSFLADDNVPMDTKTNCGHLTIILSKLGNSYDALIAQKFEGKGSFCENVGIVVDLTRGKALTSGDTWKLLNLITEETIEHSRENAKQQQMVLASSRLIFRISKVLPQIPKLATGVEDGKVLSLVRNLLDFSFAHLENFMDSVRHMSRDSIKLILAYCRENNIHSEINNLIDRISDGCSKHVRFLTISCITSVYGSRRIFQAIPDIVDELIGNFKENAFDVSAGSAYEILMLENKKEEAIDDWIERWMNPLVSFLNSLPTTEQNVKIVVETLIGKAVKNDQNVIAKVMVDRDIPINIRLTVLSMAKNCGKLNRDSENSELWKGSISISDLCGAMVHFDDRVRIQSLKLVIETNKITELYEEADLKLLKFFFKYNANCQSPATRDQIMATFKTCFIKLDALLGSCSRKKDTEGIKLLKIFLYEIRDQSFGNLKLNGNFTRRNMSLCFIELISDLLQKYREENSDSESKEKAIEEIDCLLNCLADSYECNKILALNILRQFYTESILPRHFDLLKIKELIKSVNPADSITGAYHLQLIASLAKSKNALYTSKLFVTFNWLIEIATDGIEMTRNSLAGAAKNSPIYGALFCIRFLLSEVDVKAVKEDFMWRKFTSELIQLCLDSSEAVKSIVNNSSPEGHLPNDFSPIEGDDGATDDSVTPQMILLMGWRTIKEISLLLGDISQYPIIFPSNPDSGLVTIEEFFRIGDSFRDLLAETKHRGAFEQAYVGFSQLCCRLWTSQEEELHSLPMTWLRALMDVVQGKVESNSKFCSTRRSAGVPFMVQALITSEIQVCSSRALRYSMDILFELCESEESSAEQRTHALNILRALFRCTDLNESVIEFVDRGMMAAISSFAGQTWPEKNSATLLFSALVIRIFGVQRTKDTEVLNVRNKMTGRIFFLRYPKLYDFFLRELDAAQIVLASNGRSVKLFPILLVLSRLYPSALEGTESTLSLHTFIERIANCSNCPEMKTRVLVSKSIASLLTSNLAWEYLQAVLATFETCSDLNVKHSKLLTMQQVLSSAELKLEYSGTGVEVNQFVEKFVRLPINFTHWALTKSFLEILIVVLRRFSKSPVTSLLEQEGLVNTLNQLELLLVQYKDYEKQMGYAEVSSPFVVLQLQLQLGNMCNNVEVISSVLLKYLDMGAFRESALCVLLLIMHDEENDELPDDLELTKWEKSFVSTLCSDAKASLKQQLEENVRILEISQDVIADARSSYDLRNKALALLAYFSNARSAGGVEDTETSTGLSFEHCDVAKELLDDEISYQERAATYKWYLRNCKRLEHALPLSIIEKYSRIENSFDVRMTSTEILKRIPVVEIISIEKEDKKINQFVSVVLLLLRDDDAEVREGISSLVDQLWNGSSANGSASIELYAQERLLEWMVKKLSEIYSEVKVIAILRDLIQVIEDGQRAELAIGALGCTTEEDAGNNDDVREFSKTFPKVVFN